MASALQVFVSSMCYELRDLRAAVRDFLDGLGIATQLSEDPGFPRRSGVPPHAACLPTLEDCPLVIGVLQNQYGQPLGDWGPYAQYNGLSPVHAELRYAFECGKKLLLYIHHDTVCSYHEWKSRPDDWSTQIGERRPSVHLLRLIDEIRCWSPAPYYEEFHDVTDVIKSLRRNLVNEIYASLRDQEKQNVDHARYLMDRILAAAPQIRSAIEAELSPELTDRLAALSAEREQLATKLAGLSEESQRSIEALKAEKEKVEGRIKATETELLQARILLTRAAVKDLGWLEMVRTQLMPKQKGRIPFHNDAEVALRGYHCSNVRGDPSLKSVTWSLLPYKENALHRGYRAGLVFHGSSFAPGITWTSRHRGDGFPAGQTDYFWRLPNIYFGDYLEVSTGVDPEETPISYRWTEFCVKNPEGRKSQWVEFTHAFDDKELRRSAAEYSAQGEAFVAEGDLQAADEPLRKAVVYTQAAWGPADERAKAAWTRLLDVRRAAALAKLRFREGARVKVIKGDQSGAVGVIEQLTLHSVKSYWVRVEGQSELLLASDDEVEAA